jgi:acyl-CoA thioester hydrolase
VAVDPLEYTARWTVRPYELDSNGHVNNAVYLNYAEALTVEHADRSGFGATWTAAQGGAWVVHRHLVTYHQPALHGEELELTVKVELVKGVRGVRRTWIRRAADLAELAEIVSEWVWVGGDGRPRLVPQELVALAAPATAATLASNPNFVRDLGRRV